MNAFTQTVKTMFNALAFANVGNYSEFHTLLRQVGRPVGSDDGHPRCKPVPTTSGSATIVPGIHHIPQAH